jgi:RimJ/RimL family protein N-acetyltransferase
MSAYSRHSHALREIDAATLPLVQKFGPHKTVLRALQPDDARRLMAFFNSHTAETIHRRYGYAFNHLSPLRAAALVSVDQSRDPAVGVFELRPTRRPLMAIGRYFLSPNEESCEAAFVVREDARGLGIATTLMGVLLGTARARHLKKFTAQVQIDNAPMMAVLRHAGAVFFDIPGASALQAVITLSDPPKKKPTSRSP